jgi:hypothetical protein
VGLSGEPTTSAAQRPPPLDPSGVTERSEVTEGESEQVAKCGKPRDKSRPKPRAWLESVETLTLPVREARAEWLRKLGRRRSDVERRKWRAGGTIARQGDRRLQNVPKVHPWHEARARGSVEHFRRVETCGEQWSAVARCPSTECTTARARGDRDRGVRVRPCGCGSRFFCEECRLQVALRFRRDFNAARLGLLWDGRRAGLLDRWRPKEGPGARFGERLITLVAPHREGDRVFSARERVQWLRDAINWFLRKLREHRLAQLGLKNAVLCEWARFFEWTDGDDNLGHPHWHVWDFGPWVDAELLTEWWREAWTRESGVEPSQFNTVDVRAVNGETIEGKGEDRGTRLDRELIKYLTKSWGGNAEAFAEVYAELVGKRARQTSSGFYDWSVELVHVCPDCGLVLDEPDVVWKREPVRGSALEALMTTPHTETCRGPPMPDVGVVHPDVAGHLAEEWAELDAAWAERTEAQRANLRTILRRDADV